METKRIIPVKDKKLLQQYGIWFSPSTLRKWHVSGKYRELFVKISNRLFIDLAKWKKLIEKISNKGGKNDHGRRNSNFAEQQRKI